MSDVLPPNDLVEISVERLHRLEALEASIPVIIDAAVDKIKQARLYSLHRRDKLYPEDMRLRVKKYVERNRERINARRREKRRAAARTEPPESPPPPTNIVTCSEHGATITF
jgi:hypothetical protein